MFISAVYGSAMKPPKRPRKKPTEDAGKTAGKSILVTGIDKRLATLLSAASEAEDRTVAATIRHATRLYVNGLLKAGVISLPAPSAKPEEVPSAEPEPSDERLPEDPKGAG